MECALCEFFMENDQFTKSGLCKRYAPQGGGIAGWPIVKANDWCGEFKSDIVTKIVRDKLEKVVRDEREELEKLRQEYNQNVEI